MYKYVFTILFFLLTVTIIKAQRSLRVATGFLMDLGNNKNEQFNQIPVSVEWKPSLYNKAFFIKLDYYIPISGSSTANAYTLNPLLPPEMTLQEKIRPYIFTVSLGWRVYLFSTKNKNSFYLDLLPISICNQDFKVSYKNYDKVNYDILNPDVNSNVTSFVMSAGIVYKMPLKKNNDDLMVILYMQTPLLSSNSYALSFTSVAPLQLAVGYNFNYKILK